MRRLSADGYRSIRFIGSLRAPLKGAPAKVSHCTQFCLALSAEPSRARPGLDVALPRDGTLVYHGLSGRRRGRAVFSRVMSSMSIYPLARDDAGVRSLHNANRAVGVTDAVAPLTPYPEIGPGRRPQSPPSRTEHSAAAERRRGDRRRCDERRLGAASVLLDTRNQRERRRSERRGARATDEAISARGVDLYV